MMIDEPSSRYAQVAAELQRRIEDGEYKPGDLLPSQHQLVAEFGLSRPTIVQALVMLRDAGLISTRQGQGSTVLAPLPDVGAGWRRDAILMEIVTSEVSRPGKNVLVQAGIRLAPPRVVSLLGLEPGQAFVRQRVFFDQGRPLHLASLWLPLGMAAGTGLDAPCLLDDSVRDRLRRKKNVMLGQVDERVLARKPCGEEADLLGVTADTAVLNVIAVAAGPAGAPVLAVDVVRPGDDDDFLRDAYRIAGGRA